MAMKLTKREREVISALAGGATLKTLYQFQTRTYEITPRPTDKRVSAYVTLSLLERMTRRGLIRMFADEARAYRAPTDLALSLIAPQPK